VNQLDEFQNGEETGTLKRLSQAEEESWLEKKEQHGH
jgi:hypothetical protein